MTEEKLGIC